MRTADHISTDYLEVRPSDSIIFTLNKMSELYCKQMAVVDNGLYYGLVDENMLLEEFELDQPISTLQHSFLKLSLFEDQHIYDALQLIANNDISLIPILDKSNLYIGCLTAHDVLKAVHTIIGDEDSAIIVLELEQRDNALSHITHIIESENATIYSTAVRQLPDSEILEMTIKLQRNNISAVIAALSRHNYTIKATFRDNTDQSKIESNYNLLMNYLDL